MMITKRLQVTYTTNTFGNSLVSAIIKSLYLKHEKELLHFYIDEVQEAKNRIFRF